jgi:aspartyl-tRNA(Asn)/glutamyl-tRNA(Gln) amidotransferase subunit A
VSGALHDLTIAEAARLIAARRLSPRELVAAFVARAEALQPQLDAFITPTFDLAMEQAQAAEAEIAAGTWRGPLHGIPLGLKDIFDTAGIRTTGHSRICQDRVPTADSAAWVRLRAGGAVLMGKLATHEFAHGGPSFDLPWPPARNPWNTAHTTGGSSSGSAAAVAARLMPAALGSDTGGSIRGPAGYCGIAGFKPSYGLVSRAGVMPNSWSFDHCGPMARTAEDCALLLQAMAGPYPADPTTSSRSPPDLRAVAGGSIKGLRIGVLRHVWEGADVAPELPAALEAALALFRDLGATTEDVRLRPPQDYGDVKIVMGEAELFAMHAAELRRRPQEFGQDFRAKSIAACLFTAEDYVQASRVRQRMIEEIRPLYARFDLFFTRGFAAAPRLDRGSALAFWGGGGANPFSVFNCTGQPALALPCGFTAAGLPMGFQLAGRPYEDDVVLRAGTAYERVAGWHRHLPRLVPGAAAAAVAPLAWQPGLEGADRAVLDRAAQAARLAGLHLPEAILAELVAVAPLALAMAGRIARALPQSAEVSGVFDPLR